MHAHGSDHHHGNHEERLRLATLLTGAFLIAEVVGGILSGSLALLADAAHMLTDTAALGMAWLAARLSRRPADNLRSYGYHRLQILAAFINGVAFFAVVAWILYEAATRLASPPPVRGGLMLGVAVAGLFVNLLAWLLLRGDNSNLNVRAAAVHVLGDMLGSLAAIVAAGVILTTGWMAIDPLLSVFVALLILRSAWFVVRESGHILLEGAPADHDADAIRRTIVDEVPGARDVHHIHLWSLTPDHPVLTLHVDVVADADCGAVLTAVKSVLVERFGIDHSTVQVEPSCCADRNGPQLRQSAA
jgi:cobalt-zinc-cadmium efflux system protein